LIYHGLRHVLASEKVPENPKKTSKNMHQKSDYDDNTISPDTL